MRLLRHQINRYVRRNALWIIAGIALLMAGGAAAVGPVLTGEVRGGTALTVSQAVVIDRENLTVKDLRERTDDKAVAVNDDGTGLTVAAELHNGEVFVIDVPLANLSGADASVIATLHASPGVLKDIEVFWSTQTRDTTPTARTTTPSPSPVTSTSSQSSDTTPATTAPTGTTGNNAQVSNGTSTTSSPGLPSSTPQTDDAGSTNDEPTSSSAITAQGDNAASTNSQPTGSSAIAAQVANAGSTNSEPTSSSAIAAQTASAGLTNSEPTGSSAITAQTANATSTNVQPNGAPASVSGTWYEGTFTMDVDADGNALDTVNFALVDSDSDGLYEKMDISSDADVTYGELGDLGNQVTGTGDDETITGAEDVRLGLFYTFTVAFDNNPPADGNDVRITAKTWFTGTFTIDVDADGNALDTVNFALVDSDSDGLYEKMDISSDDTTYGELGDLGNQETGTGDDETISSGEDVRLGAYYTFTVAFDNNPPADGNDARITAKTWFTGSFTIDVDADGNALDAVNFALVDIDSDGLYEKMDISSDADVTYGEGTTTNQVTGTGDDETISSGEDVRLGADYTFTVAFDNNPPADGNDARITSKTWFTGSFTIDVDADGNALDTVNFALVDSDSDGLYDKMDISSDADVTYGEGTTTNQVTGTGDDETITGAEDVRLGLFYTFTVAFDNNPPADGDDARITAKTWFTGSFTMDVDADGAADDTENFALVDSDSDGLYDKMDISSDADVTYGEGTTTNQVTGTGDDETVTGSEDVRLGAYYTFTVAFDNNPPADGNDARITSKTWFTGSFTIDVDADGNALDTVNFALVDIDSDGLYEKMDISSDADVTYGELGDLGNQETGTGDDETITGAEDVRLGLFYTFTVAFDNNPPADGNDVRITSKTWFTGTFTLDVDADGNALDTVNFALVDSDSDGLYEKMDISSDDTTYGELGDLGNQETGTGDDETISSGEDVRLGAYYTFTVAFDNNPPADGNDARITAKTWFTGSFTIDVDADGNALDAVNFALVDIDSDGLYEKMDISSDADVTYGEGTTTNQVTGTGDDETISSGEDVRLGADYTFTVAFDNNPPADGNDARITSKTWFTGSFTIDVDADGAADDTVNFALVDSDSDGLYDKMDISSDADVTYGEGTTTNQVTGTGDDETVTGSEDVRLGAYYTFTVAFDNNPPADGNDARITAKTWFTGSFTIDVDADGNALDTVNFALVDSDSNGLYDKMDISSDADVTYGEGTTTNQVTGTGDDETITGTEDVRLGADYTFTVAFDNNPPADGDDARITAKTWFTGSFTIDVDADGNALDAVNFALVDSDSDGLYDKMDISSDADVTYGEGTTTNQVTGTGDDETVTGSEDVRLGAYYTFTVAFDNNPPADGNDARITSKTHFESSFTFDADANGSLAAGDTEKLFYGLSDTDSDGLYDTMDFSLGVEAFGAGALGDAVVTSVAIGGSDNDERITATTTVKIGTTYSVEAKFDTNPPGDGSDATILLITEGITPIVHTATSWQIDADGDKVADDHVFFVLSDTNSDAVIDGMDISINDFIFGEGDTGDGVVNISTETNNTNDELVSSGDIVTLGTHKFKVEFDTDVLADEDDARITSLWYIGTFPVDVDNDRTDETLDFVLVDPNSDGLYTVFELDGDDSGGYDSSEVHKSAGADWFAPVLVDHDRDVGTHTSVAATDADTIFITYYNADYGDLLVTTSTNAGLDWSSPITVDSSDDVGQYSSLAVVDSSTLFVSYYDATSADLKFAKSLSGIDSWTIITVDSADEVGQYSSIVALNSSTIYISYYDATNSGLKIAKSTDTGDSWSTVSVDSTDSVGKFTSIDTLQTGDDIFISYYDETNGDLKFAITTGGGGTTDEWAIVTVDTGDDVGQYTSIAALDDTDPDDGDTIFISYYDVTSEDLRFAKTTSGGGSSDDWTRTTLDSEGDVGQFSSIAAAEESTVFIAYYDYTNRDLKSIRSTDGGSSFSSPVTVDSEDEVGMYASIAAIDTHMLFVSYYEANKRDLKFAKSAILVDLEGHRMSLRYGLNPTVTSSAVLKNGRITNIGQINENQWLFVIPGDAALGPNIEQTQIRLVLKPLDEARLGYYEASLTLQQIR